MATQSAQAILVKAMEAMAAGVAELGRTYQLALHTAGAGQSMAQLNAALARLGEAGAGGFLLSGQVGMPATDEARHRPSDPPW